MKGGINFELNADNIIHAPTDTPINTSLIFLRYFLFDGTNKTTYGRKKRPGYSGKLNMAERNGWSFCLLVCVRVNAIFHPRKDKIHVSFLYFLDKSELRFLGI